LISPWLLHRHEKLWHDPNAVHSAASCRARRRRTASPICRSCRRPVCVGRHFALVEAVLALAKIIGAFRVELIDREPVLPIGVG